MARLSQFGLVVLALLPLSAQAQSPIQRCQDLDAMSYQSVAAPTPLLDLLDRVASTAGWSVRSDGFGAWRGPMLRDDVPFRSAKEAVARFIRETADAGWQIGGTIDATNCVIRVSYYGQVPEVASLTPSKSSGVGQESSLPSLGGERGNEAARGMAASMSSVQEQESRAEVLAAGDALSSRIADWLQTKGWSLSWLLGYDYFLEKDLPLIDGTIEENINYVLRVYQSQGGLSDARVRIASANRVVVFERVDYAAR